MTYCKLQGRQWHNNTEQATVSCNSHILYTTSYLFVYTSFLQLPSHLLAFLSVPTTFSRTSDPRNMLEDRLELPLPFLLMLAKSHRIHTVQVCNELD